MEYILQTDGLSKVYGTKTVLNHVSIHVPKKSIYGLVGKNGAGKTTLMRIICGLTQQSDGSYTLLGKTNDPAVRKNLGMLIEKPGIYEHMTALENLRYFFPAVWYPGARSSEDSGNGRTAECRKKESQPVLLGYETAAGHCHFAVGKS